MSRSKGRHGRRVAIVVNRTGGTLRSMDVDLYASRLADAFSASGYETSKHLCPGEQVVGMLEKAAKDPATDILIACGGDGTISAAAGIAWKNGKVLGVLPGGTMNLFARALGGPLDLEAAGEHLAAGNIRDADIATANGRPFIHQFSVGLHPRIVAARGKYEYHSQIGKMLAGVRASLRNLQAPPEFEAIIEAASGRKSDRFSLISVSNNLFGEGHLPYPDEIDGGALGLYTAGPLSSGDATRLAGDLMLGTWMNNPDLQVNRETGRVVLEFPALKENARATIDGELVPLKREMTIELHNGELKVLAPKPAEHFNPLG